MAAYEARLKPATLDQRLAAIVKAHKAAGHHLDKSHPAVRDVRCGICRTRGVAQRHVEAITVPVLRRLLNTCGPRLLDVRDRSLLLLGHVGALRRSELVGRNVRDVTVLPEGLRVVIWKLNTNQEGEVWMIASNHARGSPRCIKPPGIHWGWPGSIPDHPCHDFLVCQAVLFVTRHTLICSKQLSFKSSYNLLIFLRSFFLEKK